MTRNTDFDFADVTVFIFTRNRPKFLINLVNYWSLTNIKILICDGSDVPVDFQGVKDNVNVSRYNIVSLSERFRVASQVISTKYSFLQGDDDLIPFESILKARRYLEENPSIQGVWREPYEFNSTNLFPKLGGRAIRRFSNLDESPSNRAVNYLNRAYDLHFHGFFSSDPFKSALAMTAYKGELTDEEWLIPFPVIFELSMSLHCRTLYLEEFDYLKRKMEEVPIFSNRIRELQSNIQDEIKLSWGDEQVQSKWKDFVPNWLSLTELTVEDRSTLEARLVAYARSKKPSNVIEKTRTYSFRVKMRSKAMAKLRKLTFVYILLRLVYRFWHSAENQISGKAINWTKVGKNPRFYPVSKFVKVFSDSPLGS